MIPFIVYSIVDGAIVATGGASTMDIANAQAGPGSAVLIVPSIAGVTPETHRVEGGGDEPARLVAIAQEPGV
ncbi:MAG: hypothetical protein AB1698_22495 [Pseudomonadota bacterium]